MASRLVQLLGQVFPSITPDASWPPPCWVAYALSRDPRQLGVLSDAIVVIDRFRQLPKLERRLRQEHPIKRPHLAEDDGRLLDCLTEACAFAWADMRGLGNPQFDHGQGKPDVFVPPDLWIEAKAIRPSLAARLEVHGMLGGVVSTGPVAEPSARRRAAFDSAFQDARCKFHRQGSGRWVVFSNLIDVDVDQWAVRDETLGEYVRWADAAEAEYADTSIVLCHAYQWQQPVRDGIY